jgi:hypothetical protein
MEQLIEILRINFLSPAVLAFLLGILAVGVKSDLRIPEQVYSIISIYLLFSIGLKGGFDLASFSLDGFGRAAIVTALIGAAIPISAFFILSRVPSLSATDAIAFGIHYGGVSAVTLSACITFLAEVNEPFEGFMPAMYVIMEIPAVSVGLIIASYRTNSSGNILSVIHSALTSKGFLLLGGGVLIGYLSGDLGARQVGPFFVDLFPGMLVLFLLEMGTRVGERLGELKKIGIPMVAYGIIMPAVHGLVGVWLASLIGLSIGGSMILGVLAASASFITAPAVVETNLPDANVSYYLTAALAITFPFNLIIGLPLYYEAALLLASTAT